ncbi:hypothetical protein ACTA71_009301 [Dictyostelium dimigraforme]
MAKRNNIPPSINIDFEENKKNKKKTQEPIKKFNSKREKELYQQIEKTKAERIFVYKNAHRHLKIALDDKINCTLNLTKVLIDYHAALKQFDIQEFGLRAELESISKGQETTTTDSTIATLDQSNENVTSSAVSNSADNGVSINNSSTLISKPVTRGVRTIPLIEIDSDDSEDTEKDDGDDDDDDYIDEDEEIIDIDDASPPLDSNDSTPSSPSSSPTKRVSKSMTRGSTTAKKRSGTTNVASSSTSSTTTTTTTTSTSTSTSTSPTKRKRGRPAKITPENCYVCRRTETPYWRKGRNGDLIVDLCNACGLHYMKKDKKEKLSKEKHSINNVLN